MAATCLSVHPVHQFLKISGMIPLECDARSRNPFRRHDRQVRARILETSKICKNQHSAGGIHWGSSPLAVAAAGKGGVTTLDGQQPGQGEEKVEEKPLVWPRPIRRAHFLGPREDIIVFLLQRVRMKRLPSHPKAAVNAWSMVFCSRHASALPHPHTVYIVVGPS